MSIRAVDFNSTAYAKTKSFTAKENSSGAARVKEKRKDPANQAVVKSSWTPTKAGLNEKVVYAFRFVKVSECLKHLYNFVTSIKLFDWFHDKIRSASPDTLTLRSDRRYNFTKSFVFSHDGLSK